MVGMSISHRGRMAALVAVSARRSHKPLSAGTSRSFLCTISLVRQKALVASVSLVSGKSFVILSAV